MLNRKMMLMYSAKDGLTDPIDVASMLALLPDSEKSKKKQHLASNFSLRKSYPSLNIT